MKNIKARKEYLEELLNQENEWSVVLEVTKNEDPRCEKVTLEAVLEAFRFMKNGKAAGPTSDLLKICDIESAKRLANVAIDMLQGNNMPESWRSDLIPFYKGKGDVRSCGNYRSIKLLDHGLKVIERVVEKCFHSFVKLDEMHMGFMPGKGMIDDILIVRQMMEKYEMAGKTLHGIC